MTEAISWMVALLLLIGTVFLLVREQRRRATMSEEEYEDLKQQSSLLGNAVLGLDQVLRPKVKTAMEYQQDKQRGQTPENEDEGGEGVKG
jgi:hypothetical protein